MAVKEYFIKCPERPGITTVIGTSDKKYQSTIEAFILKHTINKETIFVNSKPRIIDTVNKKLYGIKKEDIGIARIKNGRI